MGPLSGLTIIELAGIGPAPYACMWFADMGATVIRVDRQEATDLGLPARAQATDVLGRGRQSIAIDLKSVVGQGIVKHLINTADALIEGFRPGVLERLGLAPDALLTTNPKLVIGRMTGFGQAGPFAARAGHDINYIALSGALHAIGQKGGAPLPPLNLVGDYGGGGMFLIAGVLAALLSAKTTGKGQVVDAAMVDGATYLMAMFYGLHADGSWSATRGDNILDGGAPWYDVYETADGLWLAVGAIEARFYVALMRGLGLVSPELPGQHDRARWPELREAIATAIKSKTRAAWDDIFAATDACVAPVLSMAEVAAHPHMRERAALVERAGVAQPAPAPRLSLTPGTVGGDAPTIGVHTVSILQRAGYTPREVADFQASGVVGIKLTAGHLAASQKEQKP
jgi:alpha-methylacyl-CoA racemase